MRPRRGVACIGVDDFAVQEFMKNRHADRLADEKWIDLNKAGKRNSRVTFLTILSKIKLHGKIHAMSLL